MKPFGIIGIVAIIAAVIALLNSFFIVDQRQQSLVLQVGAAVQAYNEPGSDEAGLKFKIPFVQSVVTFLQQYKFDGLNIAWEFPAERGGAPEDKQNLVLLVSELREVNEKVLDYTSNICPFWGFLRPFKNLYVNLFYIKFLFLLIFLVIIIYS